MDALGMSLPGLSQFKPCFLHQVSLIVAFCKFFLASCIEVANVELSFVIEKVEVVRRLIQTKI
jgi:hypothetical protein